MNKHVFFQMTKTSFGLLLAAIAFLFKLIGIVLDITLDAEEAEKQYTDQQPGYEQGPITAYDIHSPDLHRRTRARDWYYDD